MRTCVGGSGARSGSGGTQVKALRTRNPVLTLRSTSHDQWIPRPQYQNLIRILFYFTQHGRTTVRDHQAEFASEAKAKRDARKAGGSNNSRVVWKGSQAFAKCKEGEAMEVVAEELGIDVESIISLNRLTFKGISP